MTDYADTQADTADDTETDPHADLRAAFEALQLPNHIHAELFTGTDPIGRPRNAVVVWADHLTDYCLECHQPAPLEATDCPATLNLGSLTAPVEPFEFRAGCGHTRNPRWIEVREPAAVPFAAIHAAAERSVSLDLLADSIWADLRAQYCDLIGELAEDLTNANETAEERTERLTTGSETEPGAYLDAKLGWVIWAWDPRVPGDTLTLTQCGADTAWNVPPAPASL